MRDLTCSHLLAAADAPVTHRQTIRIDGERIAAVDPTVQDAVAEPVLALPVLCNAHDHARTVRTSSIGASGKPLEIWLHYMALVPSVDPYLAAAVSLARSALGGAGVVMVHYTRTQGLTDLPTEAAEVARAARDVGIRVGFAVAMRDRNPLVYGPSEPILDALPSEAREEIRTRFIRTPLSPAAQLALVDAVANEAGSSNFDVQYGPQGVQWCTHELLTAVAEASAQSGRRVHMHLLETRYQRAWADAAYPHGIVRYLDEIGLLSSRLTLAHCTWARSDELELLAERGAIISANASSNLSLRSGIAPVAEMIARGCRVALGLDGATLDEDDDALRELRLSHLLHGGTGFRVDVDRATMLTRALRTGRVSVLNHGDGGRLAVGEPADLLLLDWDAIDDDRLRPDVDPLDLVFARATSRHIREMIVGGRTTVHRGKVMGIDFPAMREELHDRLRAAMAGNAAFAAALVALERVVHPHFETEAPCC